MMGVFSLGLKSETPTGERELTLLLQFYCLVLEDLER